MKVKILLETTIDTKTGVDDNGLFWTLCRHCCPRDFGLLKDDGCNMTGCRQCWLKAIETGVQADARFIHAERLD